MALGNKAFTDETGIKKKAYLSAVDELIEKGYLEQIKGNRYIFKERIEKPSKNDGI